MSNIILKNLIENLFESEEKTLGADSENFEFFCNYTICSYEYGKDFDIESLNTGGGNDIGIDGIAVIVNGILIQQLEDIEELTGKGNDLDIKFLFIQTKTTSKFVVSDFNTFIEGVLDIFYEGKHLTRNSQIDHFISIVKYIYKHSDLFRENPTCKLYYITQRTTDELSQDHQSAIEKATKRFTEENIFSDVKIIPIGVKRINELYKRSINSNKVKFKFENKVFLSDVKGVEQAISGVLPFHEFKNIIVDENNNIRTVFEDNVRDFQGDNAVNKNIKETLEGDSPELFSILNNGITIVANTIRSTGNNITLEDYQIVNGCQTANVLYNISRQHDVNINNIQVPIKVIATNNDNIKNKITVSTNNQTAVKKDQLLAMLDFQKELESHYTAEGHIYYERRLGQYKNNKRVKNKKVISVTAQIKSFSSIFYQNPHSVTSKYSKILGNQEEGKRTIFNEEHSKELYYLAGLLYYELDSHFSSHVIDSSYKKYRYFILMLLPIITSGKIINPLSTDKTAKHFSKRIRSKINTKENSEKLFKIIITLIDDLTNDYDYGIKSKALTDFLIKKAESYYESQIKNKELEAEI